MYSNIEKLKLKKGDAILLCENFSGYDTSEIIFAVMPYEFSCIGVRSDKKNMAWLYNKYGYFYYKKKIELDKQYSFIPVYADINATINEAVIDANKMANEHFEKMQAKIKKANTYVYLQELERKMKRFLSAKFFLYIYDTHPLCKRGALPVEKQEFKVFINGKVFSPH